MGLNLTLLLAGSHRLHAFKLCYDHVAAPCCSDRLINSQTVGNNQCIVIAVDNDGLNNIILKED